VESPGQAIFADIPLLGDAGNDLILFILGSQANKEVLDRDSAVGGIVQLRVQGGRGGTEMVKDRLAAVLGSPGEHHVAEQGVMNVVLDFAIVEPDIGVIVHRDDRQFFHQDLFRVMHGLHADSWIIGRLGGGDQGVKLGIFPVGVILAAL